MRTDFDLNLLRVLVAIHRTQNVSKAAAELNLSQPATSQALRRLRAVMKDELFIRTPSGMLPTPRGSKLIGAAEQALVAVDVGLQKESTFDPLTARRDFVVTMADVGELAFLPKLMAHLSVHAPLCNLRCEQVATSDVSAALESGKIDLALGLFPNLEKAGFFMQQLYMHSLVSLVRVDHPRVSGNRVPMRVFLDLSHAVIHPQGRSHELFEALLKSRRIQRRVQLLSGHFLSLPAIIAATDLIATVPLAVAEYFLKFERLKIVEPPLNIGPYPLKQHWHSRFHNDPEVTWLREAVFKLFNTKDR